MLDLKNSSLHTIKDIKDLGQQEEVNTFNFSDVKCLEHSDHQNEEELDDKKKVVLGGQKKAERRINELSSSSFQLKDIKEQEDAKFKKQDVLTHREALKSEVDQYDDNILKDLEQTWKSNSSVTGAEQSKIDKTLANLQTDSKTLQSAITSKDFVKFFDDFDKLAISLNQDEPLSKLEISLLGRFMPGNITISKFGSVEDAGTLEVQQPKFEFKVAKQFTAQLRHVHHIDRCSDGTLWIYDCISKKLQHIKFYEDKIEIMLVGHRSFWIVAGGKTRLKIINSSTGRVTDSNYDVKPYTSQVLPECVHITNDHRVIVGVGRIGTKAAVIVMDQDGRTLAKCNHDSNREPILSCPKLITNTTNGNICVKDMVDSNHRRVVVLGKEGKIKQVYTGHPTINNEEKQFSPNALVTTPADNIVITDFHTSTLHVLNCGGNLIGYYNLYDIGIIYPCSISLSTKGHMYIGCLNREGSPETLKAKLFELEYSGF
ncbi:Hypothetical predicted protein [Mytilus galloprovincialis]|uniref:Uncharacterized protein n=1 Tax=Mytilus galloprovincialis TaxID=29158 RepID=A0A8B6H638_MYTGA|nr:Hypothetical predicted protein [Mytilus galloprovincialis]